MSSQNNKLICHSLATILTKNRESPSQIMILRLKKHEMTASLIEPEDVNINHYFGPRKPPMLCVLEVNLSDIFIYMQQVSHARVQIKDFQFFKDIVTETECSEYNGYC